MEKGGGLERLGYTLHALSLVMAPSMPFLAEHVFQTVREGEDEESVHLARWPEGRATANFLQRIFGRGGADEQLIATMSLARDVVSKALEARDSAKIKVRQPLQKLTVDGERLAEDFLQLIRDEVNVKEILFGKDMALDTTITPALREEGVIRDTVRLVQDARKAAKMQPGERGAVSIQVPHEDIEIVKKNLGMIEKETNTSVAIN